MKILVCNVVCMLSMILLGKRAKTMGFKQYSVIALITAVQVVVAVYSMYTMQEPPMF